MDVPIDHRPRGLYIGHVTSHMSPAYATVGTVVALLIWLHLGAELTLYAAELNVVLDRHLWPRPLREGKKADATPECADRDLELSGAPTTTTQPAP